MQFDFNKTFELIKGGLLDHEATWRGYLAENNSWQQTAAILTGPLIVASFLCQLIFSRLVGGFAAYGYEGAGFFIALVIGLLMALLGFAVLTAVVWFLANKLEGSAKFDRVFAGVSLALIPSYVASAIGALIPWLGILIAVAGGIVSLFFLWKIIPMALEIPNEKRALHYILSLVVTFVINMILGLVLVAPTIGASIASNYSGGFADSDRRGGTSGMFSEMERQGQLVEAAQRDRFEPPADGKLDDDQVEELIDVLEKTEAARERYAERMRKMSEEIENKDKPSFGDITKVYSGIGGAVGASNAEMEVVKTGGGNWAEHQWVKNQLRTAILQQGEGSEAIEHNFELYQEYEDELDNWF